MQFIKQCDWIDPLELSKNIPDSEGHWCLLYSGSNTENLGGKSFLAFGIKEIKQSNEMDDIFDNSLDGDLYNRWFGYLSYDLKNSIEDLKEDAPSIIEMPNLLFMSFNNIVEFDHGSRIVNLYSEHVNDDEHKEKRHPVINTLYGEASYGAEYISDIESKINSDDQLRIRSLESNMTKDEYIEKVEYIIDEIKKGTLYQANLTRKFYGSLSRSSTNGSTRLSDFDLFAELSETSPSPYSCYFKINDVSIISSSPEQFIKSDKNGNVISRPIKGTAPRKSNAIDDAKSLEKLINSTKDKAENLMIVDLMRNDFSKGCKKTSVYVEDLFKVNSYKSVHHMSSKITGKIKGGVTSMEFIRNCFPPGSMTGTPKIKAMEICSELEGIRRGVYSGCIGWIDEDGSFDTSVVIRTIILKGDIFEFQVGGAIVYDSVPEEEWMETIYKAQDICDVLNISTDKLQLL